MNLKKRLGELLVEAGVLDALQLQTALAHQRKSRVKLGQALVELNLATEPQIVGALSRKLGYEVAKVGSLQRTQAMEEALKLVPADVAIRHSVLPVAADAASLTVVMSDPSNITIVDELAFRTGRRIRISLAGDRELQAAVRRFYVSDEEQQRRGVAQHGAASGPLVRPTHAVVTAAAVRSPTPPPEIPENGPSGRGRTLSAREAAVLDSARRAARGDDTTLVKPGQLAAALAGVLLRKGLVTEAELVDEILKP